MKKSPLDDLSFFRFPDLTADTIQSIAILFVVMAITVVVTVILQRWIYRFSSSRQKKKAQAQRVAGSLLTPQLLEVFQRLLRISSFEKGEDLLADPSSYEKAVNQMAGESSEDEIALLARLRQMFHLNVMNSELAFVSTRQLLPDLPLRLATVIDDERLDLYCTVLNLDEQFIFFDMSHDQEIYKLLCDHPRVKLIFWRENEDETVFNIRLEPVHESGKFPVFRASHAFRSEESGQRADFRLTVDIPVQYQFMARDSMRKIKGGQGGDNLPKGGEGNLLDLSYGGAAFVTDQTLPPGGFAQLQFQVQGKPLRIMLEVISNLAMGEGRMLVHGRLRGMSQEAKSQLYGFLSREQLRRLREKKTFHYKTRN